jgi:hypothetical protein
MELRVWLDELAPQLLGISGTQFIEAYRRGELWDIPIAHSLAAVLPLLEPGDRQPEAQ